MNLTRTVEATVARATGRLARLVRRGLLKVCTSSFLVQLEGYDGERYDEAEYWQQYGLASRPPSDAEVLFALIEGAGEQPIAFGTNSRAHRPTDLQENEVALYGPKVGADQSSVRMRPDGDVDLLAPASGKHVHVGGETDFILKGTTFDGHMETFLNSLAAAVSVAQVASAASAMLSSRSSSSWLAEKGKTA